MESEDASASTVVSPLEKVVAGRWNKQIQLPDLEQLLSNEEFLRDMLVTVNEEVSHVLIRAVLIFLCPS